MGNKGGLPSVPRGLDQGLTLYLQSLDGIVRRMAGMLRGTVTETQAARSTAGVPQRQVPASSSTAVSVAGVGTSQLADGAVGSKQLKQQAVITDILADGAVTRAKLADGILTEWQEGTAQDGEDINLGSWAGRPAMGITGFDVPISNGGSLSVGLDNLRHDGTVWRCTARAACNGARGLVHWQVMGKRA